MKRTMFPLIIFFQEFPVIVIFQNFSVITDFGNFPIVTDFRKFPQLKQFFKKSPPPHGGAWGRFCISGINSKVTPLGDQSNSCLSSYGWSTNNYIWSNEQPKSSCPNKCIGMKNGDIINLIIDCDKYLIMMINEGSEVKHELAVNVDNCPLPWQLYVILHEPNSRIRLLQD